ncbi:polysaccharide biosynthesis/export family protein [Novipirellula artificiosorum]|uniref:SLBB domain protein n=1 Tax=Novipirellula artificiosorum TaxID=2528016 RepID=A0A5C6DD78_9BACT|nr:SLBB domain-containing protein [Novipirellula artificiosorum]TWU34205.1 SLBB domain protein [Novipirellula artificiosorum]
MTITLNETIESALTSLSENVLNHRILLLATSICLLPAVGCSTLGLSLYPKGSFLTEQAERVLDGSPTAAELPRELNRSVIPVHYLEPGDVLLVEPVHLGSEVRLPADQHVMADGSIDLGGFGRCVVAGLTLEEAEQLVERTITDSAEEETQINIRLLEPVHHYYVLGEVNSPGSYPLSGFETVLDGILAAGGLTSDAAPCKILLARPTTPCSCRVTLPVCYREITQLGDTTTNYQLQPGDRIFVSTRSCLDELMFWQSNETCQRCCRSQRACCRPDAVATLAPVTPGLFFAAANPLASDLGFIETEPSASEISASPNAGRNLESQWLPEPTPRDSILDQDRLGRTRQASDSTASNPPAAADGQLDFPEALNSEPLELPNVFARP